MKFNIGIGWYFKSKIRDATKYTIHYLNSSLVS